MAKKSASNKTPTPEQLKKLASAVIDTRKNAYREAESLGFTLDDEGWTAMEKQEAIFRCESCSEWQPVANKACGDLCGECAGSDDE